MAATNAISCANMAMADFDPLIPLDQVIEAMRQVGNQMAHELRCTGLGGLSTTQASKELEAKLHPELALRGEEGLDQISRRFKVC